MHPFEVCDVWIFQRALGTLTEQARRVFARNLSAEESERARSFAFEHLRDAFLASHALVRDALSFCEPTVAPNAWDFRTGSFGKPFVSTALTRPLWFSLSHSEQVAMVAVSRDFELGLDVEALRRGREILALGSSVFTAREHLSLAQLPPDVRERRAVSLWTVKESYVKARGDGLAFPLESIDCGFDAAGHPSVNVPEAHTQAHFASFAVLGVAGHCAALTTKSASIVADRTSVRIHGPVSLDGGGG